MRAALLAVLLATSVQAADTCPVNCVPRETLTCEQRLARAKAHGCVVPTPPCKAVPCAPVAPLPCVGGDNPNVLPGLSQTEKVKMVPYYVPPPKPTGHPLFGGGPVWQNGWGATLVAGYQFKSGFQLVGGPVWLQHNSTTGDAAYCPKYQDKKDDPMPCVAVPFRVEPQQPWGAQLLGIYVFK